MNQREYSLSLIQKFAQNKLSESEVNKAADTFSPSWGFHSWLALSLIQKNISLDNWPTPIRMAYLHNEWRVSQVENEYKNLAKALNLRNHEYCLLKGLWFAKKVLPAPGLRLFHDVDLWVSNKAYSEIDQIMFSQGFESIDKLHHRFHFHKAFQKELPHLKITFEVHKALSLDDFHKFNHTEVWSQAIRYPSSKEIELLPIHHFIYVFCHNSLHSFDRLSRLMDLPIVYSWAQKQNINQTEVMDLLNKWKCRRLYLYSLVALEWLMEKELETLLFPKEDVRAAKNEFHMWLEKFLQGEELSYSLRRTRIADSPFQAMHGLFHPKRIMGALVDRLGMY